MDKIDLILQKMDLMQGGITQLQEDVTGLKTDVANLQEGLRAVADGHFDLMRRFDIAIDHHCHREQLYIRMLHLSTQIDQIQRNCKYCRNCA